MDSNKLNCKNNDEQLNIPIIATSESIAAVFPNNFAGITNIPHCERYRHLVLDHSKLNVSQRRDLVVGSSTLGPHAGRGLFIILNECLAKDETICVYFGRRLTPDEADIVTSNYKLFDPEAGWVVDAEGFESEGYFGGLINHANIPQCNCYYFYDKEQELYLVKSIKDYDAGVSMELFVNYGEEYNLMFDRSSLLSQLIASGFKMPWMCALCGFDNSSYPSICECCDSINPDYAPALAGLREKRA